MPEELWPAIAAHWSEARCFRAMADALENLPRSVTQIEEGRSLGDIPLVVLSASTASAEAITEHECEAALSTRGEHKCSPERGALLIQLDDPRRGS